MTVTVSVAVSVTVSVAERGTRDRTTVGSFTPIDSRFRLNDSGTEPTHPETRRHQDTKGFTKATHPPENAEPAQPSSRAEAQSPTTPPPAQRRCSEPRELSGVARSPAVGRPETAVSGLRVEPERSPRSPAPAARALGERRPRYFSPSFKRMETGPSLWLTAGRTKARTDSPILIFYQEDGDGTVPTADSGKGERQNRRAPGTAAVRKCGDDERSGSESPRFLTAAGDPIACRSAATTRESAHARNLPLCVFASLRLCVRKGGWVAFVISSCLRAFVVATWVGGSVPSLCSPCLCGSQGRAEIRNSNFEIRNRLGHLKQFQMSRTFERSSPTAACGGWRRASTSGRAA